MHEVIVCEKPTSAEKIAKALSPSAKRKYTIRKLNIGNLKRIQRTLPLYPLSDTFIHSHRTTLRTRFISTFTGLLHTR